MSHALDEIASQPACWRAALRIGAAQPAGLPEPGERVAVTGCGTSLYMAQAYAALNATVDATWLIAVRYRAEGGSDASVFVGAGIALWVVWVASAIPGYLLGAFIADPKRFGFDLMLPIFFAAMFIPLWRGVRRAIGWAIAGLVALAVSYLVPGWWFIVIGALTGSIVGAFIDDE